MPNDLSAVAKISLILVFIAVLGSVANMSASSGYKVIKTIRLSRDGAWDYIAVDSDSRRLYITRETHVEVVEEDTGAVIGDITGTEGVHGVALVPEFGRGFTTNGHSNTVTIFDLKSLKVLSTVKTGADPDSIAYDGTNKLIFVTNEHGKSVTVIKAMEGTVAATIQLADEPEFVIADDQGHVYVNLDDPAEIAVIDTATLSVSKRVPLTHCQEPTALAMDQKARRLFAACRNETMMVLDPDAGKVVAKVPIGAGVDGMAFDPSSQ
ncbi:MAG: YncE family protein, partial [Acidobacteriota bacterium]|nr:YncE family protein [Acidobacteriota bacterium]